MQTITQSVVESYTKLVYKYIKQDIEAENNHTDWIFIGIFTLGIIVFLADRILQFVGRKALKRFGVR